MDIFIKCSSKAELVQTFFRASLVAQLVKNSPAMWETWVGKISWRREWLPTLVSWPGEFCGLRNSSLDSPYLSSPWTV